MLFATLKRVKFLTYNGQLEARHAVLKHFWMKLSFLVVYVMFAIIKLFVQIQIKYSRSMVCYAMFGEKEMEGKERSKPIYLESIKV